MLLFDRVIEKACHARKKGTRQFAPFYNLGPNKDALEMLASTPVYNLENVAPLFEDWEREKTKAISKRPPHDLIWAEWKITELANPTQKNNLDNYTSQVAAASDSEGQVWDWEIGAWICKIDPGLLKTLGFLNPNMKIELEKPDREVYSMRVFRKLARFSEDRTSRIGAGVEDEVSIDGAIHSLIVGADGTDPRRFIWLTTAGSKPLGRKEYAKANSLFGLNVSHAIYENGRYSQISYPWPAFLCFSLLHCKNVVTEKFTPDESIQRKVSKSGNPPRTSFKVLRIQGSEQSDKPRADSELAESGPKKRFHLCRGHFKNLQAERYANKGWHWWPAHWRGDEELGRVEKTYSVV